MAGSDTDACVRFLKQSAPIGAWKCYFLEKLLLDERPANRAFGQWAYFAFPKNAKGDAKEVTKMVARPPSLLNLT